MILLLIIGSFCTAFLLAWGLNSIALIPWRKSVGKHWTERARLLYPARVSSVINTFLIPANLISVQLSLEPEISDWWLALAITAWLGAVLGGFPFNREVFPQFNFRSWLHQVWSTWTLYLGVLFVYAVCALIMPVQFGWPTIAIASVALLFRLWQLCGLHLKLLCWIKLLNPADKRLQRIVMETSSRMGIPVRGVWILTGIYAQAFALPTTRELLFSKRLLEICDDSEVSAICAHELGHLTESKMVLFRRIVGSIALFPLIFFKPAIHAFNPFMPLLLVLPALLLLVVRGLSIRMEKRADQVATDNQTEPGVYGRALEKLYRENLIPAVNASNRRSHPHLYDRLFAAGITPDYPKPLPPKRLNWTSYLMLASAFILPVLISIVKILPDFLDAFVIKVK
jgi:Zn-dependent protease with chaperone function